MKKTVLVTGASKGIGFAACTRLASKGYAVIGIARNPSTESFPGTFFTCDLSDIEKTANILRKIATSHHVDAIINNVGVALPQSLEQLDLTSLQTVYDLNIRTAVQITQAFVENMKQNHWGRIINISSRAIFGVKNRTSYAAAKSALIGCTRTWALEFATYGITVNAIAPGPVETELFRKTRPIGSAEEKATLAEIPMGRIGKPSEIAATIEFLLSEDAGFITGQTLCVDGGSSL